MIDFIKNYNLKNISTKLQIIYFGILINLLLNVIFIKIIYTLGLTLIFTGGLYRNYFMFILFNGIIPGILIYLLYYKIKSSNKNILKVCNILINLTLLFSLLPLGLNIYNLCLLL